MKKNKRSRSVGSSVFLALLLVFTGVSVFVYFYVILPSKSGLAPRDTLPSIPGTFSSAVTRGEKSGVFSSPRKQDVFNVLVVGRDAAGANTDVVMLCSIDAAQGRLSVLQIPRDSYVDDPVNEGRNKKLNSVYALAYNSAGVSGEMTASERQRYALSYLCRTVGGLFGVDVDRYVYVDLGAFRNIVDLVGGVEVDVPEDLDYDDPAQDLHIHLKAGRQTLYGSDAEGFVRFRSGYSEADLARLDAQKIFLGALARKLLSSAAARLPQLMESVREYFLTDLTLSDMSYLASAASGLDTSRILMATASGGAFVSQSGAWFYGLDPDGNLELVNGYFNCRTEAVSRSDMKIPDLSPDAERDRGASDVYSADDVNSKKLLPR